MFHPSFFYKNIVFKKKRTNIRIKMVKREHHQTPKPDPLLCHIMNSIAFIIITLFYSYYYYFISFLLLLFYCNFD